MTKQPRPYTFHTSATTHYIRQHYGRQTLPEIAADLGLPYAQLKSLACR
ncbi:hypothetical protein [Hymenobacter coccineus]|nr:hypothetical protein [Hymenobacter coccineus]